MVMARHRMLELRCQPICHVGVQCDGQYRLRQLRGQVRYWMYSLHGVGMHNLQRGLHQRIRRVHGYGAGDAAGH
jgi:hypothetical protein